MTVLPKLGFDAFRTRPAGKAVDVTKCAFARCPDIVAWCHSQHLSAIGRGGGGSTHCDKGLTVTHHSMYNASLRKVDARASVTLPINQRAHNPSNPRNTTLHWDLHPSRTSCGFAQTDPLHAPTSAGWTHDVPCCNRCCNPCSPTTHIHTHSSARPPSPPNPDHACTAAQPSCSCTRCARSTRLASHAGTACIRQSQQACCQAAHQPPLLPPPEPQPCCCRCRRHRCHSRHDCCCCCRHPPTAASRSSSQEVVWCAA